MNTPLTEIEALRWLKEASAAELEVQPELQARVWQRVSSEVGALSLGCYGTEAKLGPTAAPTSVASQSSPLRGAGWQRAASKFARWSAPALVVGAAAGAAGHAAFVKGETRTVYVDRVVRVPEVSVKTPSSEPAAVNVESLPLDTTAPATVHSQSDTQISSTPRASASGTDTHGQGVLARERGVLDPARLALAAGEPARALEQVRQHGREFPNGILSEEREAIAINALVALGYDEQASKRAASFRTRYPNSLMTYSVDAALATIRKK